MISEVIFRLSKKGAVLINKIKVRLALKKKLPIGLSDFKELIEDNYYYVDKSLFIKEIIDDGSKVILFPRPRRFGKTLNLSYA